VKSLRDAIYDQLVAKCPSFTGGFFQPQVANESTPKPFGVIRIGPAERVGNQGIIRRLEVHVHAAKENWATLDTLCRSVVDALHMVRVSAGTSGGKTYYVTPKHTGTTSDWVDDDRETMMHIVEFDIPMGA